MKTEAKRYYTDAYTTSFAARIVERAEENGRIALVLDDTFFYPTSGGQPHDTGTINSIPVVDVTVRDEDGTILHWVEKEVAEERATAVIDWSRRFDHMQQHTGQHILSQAFIRTAEAETVGFHLSDETVTIDLNTANLNPQQLLTVEQLANQIVFENRPIGIHFVSLEEAQSLSIRKIPPTRNGRLRLIDIANFDLTACGGTHVDRTGSVGMIKIIKTERRADQTRIEFRCGQRALSDYRTKNDVLLDLSTTLTTGYTNLPASIEKLREENKQNGRLLKKLKTDFLRYEAQELLQNGRPFGDYTLISRVFTDKDGDDLRMLGSQLRQNPNAIALLGISGAKVQLVFGRGANAVGDMNQLLRLAFQQIKGGGGGSPDFAQGGGPGAEKTAVENAIAHAAQQLTLPED